MFKRKLSNVSILVLMELALEQYNPLCQGQQNHIVSILVLMELALELIEYDQ